MAAKMSPTQELAQDNAISTNKRTFTTERSAWGKPMGVHATSLSEVMSEQLATHLEEKDLKEQGKKENRDLALANLLEESEVALAHCTPDQGTSSLTDNKAKGTKDANIANNITEDQGVLLNEESSDTKDDFLIAQMLQCQFDNENDVAVKNEESNYNGNSKVKLSYEKYKVLQSDHPIWEDSDEEDPEVVAYLEMDDRKRDWDYYETADKETLPMPRCGYQKIGGSIITKHDKELSQRSNGKRVMAFPPGIQTGDGGSFDMQLSNSVYNELRKFSNKDGRRRAGRIKDKMERSTAEQAVDPQTKLILFKLINNGILDNVNGVIATGKEAVIFHAEGGPGPEPEQAGHSKGAQLRDKEVEPMNVPKECVIKVFKTTLNEFKNREIYIKDDYRFRARFSKQNPRKVIHMWAEKELHNLIKMSRHGLCVPEAVLLKKHVLLMSFIGHDGKPAPKLKDAVLSYADLEIAYDQTLDMMTRLYSDCHLVHADLSEYNILWHDDQCWFIDVSQSVEPNHPHGLEFLYRDCVNVSSFFEKNGVLNCLSPQRLFTNITGFSLPDDDECPKSEAEILARVRDFERSQEILSLSSNCIDDDPDASLELLADYDDEKNVATFKNSRVQDCQSGKQYPFDYCWEESLKQKHLGDADGTENAETSTTPWPIPGHAKPKGGKSGKSPKSPNSGSAIVVSKSPKYFSKSPKSPKSGASLASMTSEELKELKDCLVEEETDEMKKSTVDKKPNQVNFKI